MIDGDTSDKRADGIFVHFNLYEYGYLMYYENGTTDKLYEDETVFTITDLEVENGHAPHRSFVSVKPGGSALVKLNLTGENPALTGLKHAHEIKDYVEGEKE